MQNSQNQMDVIKHVCEEEDVDRLRVVAMINHLAMVATESEAEAQALKGELRASQSAYDLLKLLTQAKQGELAHAEQQVKDLETVLKAAKALLTDWVVYNDNKKNADIAPATHALLKKLEQLP